MTIQPAKILIIDDDKDVLLAARLLLKKHFSIIKCCEDPHEIPSLMGNDVYDIILLDMNFTQDATSGKEGFVWLADILKRDPLAVVILITAYGDIQTAVKAIREGATDFVLKPWENERLLATASTALNLRRSKTEVSILQHRQKQLYEDIDSRFHNMIGNSPLMRSIFHKINKVAETDVNVLITGENGTGKELVARALHRASSRAEGVFISVDMGALAENIFESELFGYEKGAFTDAKQDRHGRFEIASEGTLFLDEISNISLSNQAKILRVLEERQVVRLGSSKPIPFDIRLICATNASLNNMVSEGTFRQDLLYRVNTIEINLPPLREREEDIALLIEHFTSKFAKKYRKQPLKISSIGMKQLLNHSWPGNIRELKHTVERLVIMSDGSELDMNEFFSQTLASEPIFESYNLEYIEKMVIVKVLKRHGGNISHSASELGLTRAALYRRMSKYGL